MNFFLKLFTKQEINEGIDLFLYLKGITEETGDFKRLLHCYEYSQYLKTPIKAPVNPNLSAITLTKKVDRFTPALNLASATNLTIPDAILYFFDNKSKKIHYMITLYGVYIPSTRQYLKAGKVLCDTFTLEFDKIKWEYDSTSTCWNIKRKKPLLCA